MSDRKFINEDGSIKDDILAMQQAAVATSTEDHGIDEQLVEELISETAEKGYVIVHELMSKQFLASLKEEVLPLLQFDGRNEFEGSLRSRTRRPSP